MTEKFNFLSIHLIPNWEHEPCKNKWLRHIPFIKNVYHPCTVRNWSFSENTSENRFRPTHFGDLPLGPLAIWFFPGLFLCKTTSAIIYKKWIHNPGFLTPRAVYLVEQGVAWENYVSNLNNKQLAYFEIVSLDATKHSWQTGRTNPLK